MRKDVKKNQMQIDTDLYIQLVPLRRPGKRSIKMEPVQNVVRRLLAFYLENGGRELEEEYRKSINQ